MYWQSWLKWAPWPELKVPHMNSDVKISTSFSCSIASSSVRPTDAKAGELNTTLATAVWSVINFSLSPLLQAGKGMQLRIFNCPDWVHDAAPSVPQAQKG